MDIAPGNLDTKPSFYNNISGMAQTYRSDSGGVVNSSLIPVIKHINQLLTFTVEQTYLNSWNNAIIGHGIGKIYYSFIRWRLQGDTNWTMCPQVNYEDSSNDAPFLFGVVNYSESSMEFGYYNYLEANLAPGVPLKDKNIEVDIYFVNIPFNV